jgi:outer membrane protein OmpA-like peptidoglycan-associated protein
MLGMIGKRTVAQNMNAGGLRSYLGEQRSIAAGLLPGSLSRLIVPAGAAVVAVAPRRMPDRPAVRPAPDQPAERRAVPWWLIGLLAVVGIGAFAWSRMHREPARQAAVTSETSLPASALTAGGVSALSGFLDGNAPVPQRFVLQDLRFNTDSADIEPSSARVLDDVAAVLASHEGAKIRVEGHTDATGPAATNRQLSQARADETKRYLATRGVDGTRIETAGYGADRPLATNDTAAGRAENRRTELVVVAR